MRIPYVAGDVVGINRPSERLAAASENVMLAPHWWHFVAVAPTSVPHAGHSFGRAFSGLFPKSQLIDSRARSNFHLIRGERGNWFPC